MKKLLKIMILGSLLSIPILTNAQFNLGINPDGRTNNNIRSVGIGTFTNFNRPKANLNVNQLLMPNSPFFSPGHIFRTDGNDAFDNIWSLNTGANTGSLTEKFKMFIPANSNDLVMQTSQNGVIRLNTNSVNRLLIDNGNAGNNAGRLALGNNLVGSFTPANRLHLHQDGGNFGVQFTNNATGIAANNGFSMNLLSNQRFEFRQYQPANVQFQMPNSLLMELVWNNGPFNHGQINFGPVTNPIITPGNPMYNPAVANFGGAIAFSHPAGPNVSNTLMYYNTRMEGNPTSPSRDGFRMLYDFHSQGQNQSDCLVFEKTDGQSIEPDGCIKFTNVGTDTIPRLSMTIVGNGHVGIGRPYNFSIKPWRRLSVQDTAVQFRISNKVSNLASAEVYTDFFTNTNGELLIDPRNGSNTNAGNVKINYGTGLIQPYPNVSLDVNGQTNIRTVNLDNTLDKVLVWDNASGNVRYADATTFTGAQGPQGPQGTPGPTGPAGPAGGIIAAQNGLNLLNPSTVELGGALLHNTEVNCNNFDMVFNNVYGNFIVGTNNVGNPMTGAHQNIILGIGNNINNINPATHEGWNHHVLGNYNDINKLSAHIFGNQNIVSGENDFVIGVFNNSNTIGTANNSFTIGSYNTNIGYFNHIIGRSNSINGQDAFTYGNNNITNGFRAHGYGNIVYAPEYIVSFGNSYSTNSALNIQNYVNGGGNLNSIHNDPNFTTGSQDIPAINISNTNNVAIKKYAATAALDVWGNILQSGTQVTSDASLKHNVQDLSMNADSLLSLLRPRTFEWNSIQDTFMLGTQYGFIAQEFETVIPEFVRAGKDSIKHINNGALFPLLVAGYQFQQHKINELSQVNDSLQTQIDTLNQQVSNQSTQIQDLNNRLTQLENCLSGILPFLCQLSHQAVQANTPAAQEEIRKTLEVKLSNKDVIVLDQNVPNPFAEQTVINFSIPESVKKAQILFHDGMGKLLQAVDIQQRGLGSITVFGSDLSAGTYTYTLVADGINVATKRMVKY